ncbi:RAD9, HUS1, RAD1-interacting nuclear orphan protein 1 isoform X2 [Lemur catta]|uniref:RAD9, HUS1, RAD1-interacting nuclear orphan protein 1 isoform X2 n=1 Tax=Lemur catta TaxID=9447 RepID=UPI001E26B1C9|nr:RAD9, HUS1, RAD1-interacting nuclear orphan protein 1 isoform X2 [Lemur catta]XP_045410541.1 RAD9, HUS1, RAD1-interacting nuclear orphan protein 1 isoform X2 [Lemur catta]
MPPRKKRPQRSQKARLLFHHQPLEGPKHRYGSPQLPITHTRQISPEFDTTAESQFPAYRKHHYRDQARHSSRKSTTSKFPHLTFESPQSSSISETLEIPLIKECPNQPETDNSRGPLVPMLSPQSCGDLSVHALQSLPYVFIPPDIQTPESSSVKEEPVPPEQKENSLPSCSLHTTTTSSPEPGPILVKDTPENKYGLKVTWRRRQHLLAYLRERGKLSRSQFLVKN